MIIDALLSLGRCVDRLLGSDRPAHSALSVWRMPLQVPDDPWSALDESSMLTQAQAAELLDADLAQSSPSGRTDRW